MTQLSASAETLAREAIGRVLATQWDRHAAVVVDSPPGAGKTGIVERVSALTLARFDERCMVATQTNEQAFDLVRRMSRSYVNLKTHLLVSKKLALPDDVPQLPNVQIITDAHGIPAGPCAVVANAAKWSWLEVHEPLFDLQLIDEAFQLPDYRFQLIAGLARRFLLVGDPGQIEPLIRCELERWRTDLAGPHVPAPTALLQRHPGATLIKLPVSRRLVADTVSLVQPAFYPDLPFQALGGRRSLSLAASGVLPVDAALNAVAAGASLVHVQLPAGLIGEADEQMAGAIVSGVRRLFERGARVVNDGESEAIVPEMIGIACAHVSQVGAIRELLGDDLDGVLVETANRFQGLERPIMFVYHPLSGRADASAFHLDAGRLCVMLSRHRVACFIYGRDGIMKQLLLYAPIGNRVLRVPGDPEFRGWQAHVRLIEAITRAGRVFQIPLEAQPRRRARRRS